MQVFPLKTVKSLKSSSDLQSFSQLRELNPDYFFPSL